MRHELVTLPDAPSLAASGADFVATLARATVAERGVFTFAVSGGSTPWAMFAELAHHDVPWAEVRIFQVDERVAPAGDPDRNLTHLTASLGTRAEPGVGDAGQRPGHRGGCRRLRGSAS